MRATFSDTPVNIKLQISVMSARGWSPMFGHCYAGLAHRLGSKGIQGFGIPEVLFDTTSGQSLIALGRHSACKKAMENGCTHILMIDDDMQFPNELCDWFFNRRVPVIAANCLKKRDTEKQGTCIRLDGTNHVPEGRQDAEEVLQVGTGIILINLDSIRHLPNPLFDTPWLEEINSHLGEDYYFCNKARKHGVKIYVDNLVSNCSAHMGEFAYHWGNDYPLNFRGWTDLLHCTQKNPLDPQLVTTLQEAIRG